LTPFRIRIDKGNFGTGKLRTVTYFIFLLPCFPGSIRTLTAIPLISPSHGSNPFLAASSGGVSLETIMPEAGRKGKRKKAKGKSDT
jgi:hypothetical protein